MSQDTYPLFERFDLADFAQEFLRRSPAYQTQYAEIFGKSKKPVHSIAIAMAHSWGLEFPGFTKP